MVKKEGKGKAKGKGRKVAAPPLVTKKVISKKVVPKKVVNPLIEKPPRNLGIGKWKAKGKEEVAAPPLVTKKVVVPKKVVDPLIQKPPRDLDIGGDIQPKRDMGRIMRKFVRLQQHHLNGATPIHQFKQPLDRQKATELFRLLDKYRLESKAAKWEHRRNCAAARAAGKPDVPTERKIWVRQGVRNVTKLVEQKKAQLVCIANDVVHAEIVLFLPELCRKMDVPFCIVENKSRLGAAVDCKETSCLAITGVEANDRSNLNNLLELIKTNDHFDKIHKNWGGGIPGAESAYRIAKLERAKARNLAPKC